MGAIQFIVVLVAGVGGWLAALLTWRASKRASDQKEVQASREEWWRRFAWATELALDTKPMRARAGLRLLRGLTRSVLAGRDEVFAVWDMFDHLASGTTIDTAAGSAHTGLHENSGEG